MEKQAGLVLTDVWERLKGKQKVRILDQIVDIERRLAATELGNYGSLYYKLDLDPSYPPLLYRDAAGKEVRSQTFAVGPTNHRSFFDFGRGQLDIERGPCKYLRSMFRADPYQGQH